MVLEGRTSRYLVVSALLFTVLAAYLAQSRVGHGQAHTKKQKSSDLAVEMSRGNKVVCVLGTLQSEFSFTEKLGELIAKNGFDLVTGGLGGNMDKVREAFYKAKTPEQHSVWCPNTNPTEKDAKPPNQDEIIPAVPPEEKNYVARADFVIALPGGPGVVAEIGKAKEHKKPCIGFLTPDDEKATKKDGAEFVVNALVKTALSDNGFSFVFAKDGFQKIEEFLGVPAPAESGSGDEDKKSCALNIVHGSAFGILALGLLAANM